MTAHRTWRRLVGRAKRGPHRRLDASRTAALSSVAVVSRGATAGWRQLSDAVQYATSRGRSAALHGARGRVAGLAGESRRRARTARDALAGRYPRRRPRPSLVAMVAAVAGALATLVAQRVTVARERAMAERIAVVAALGDRVADVPAPAEQVVAVARPVGARNERVP